MITKPYSAAAKDAFNAADYSFCKLFLQCTERAGTVLADAVSGSTINLATALSYANPNSVIMPAGASAANIPLPASIDVGTKAAVMFCVLKVGGFGNVALGTNALSKFQIGYTGGITVADGTNSVALANSGTGNAVFGYGVGFVPGANATKTQAALASGTAVATNAAGTPAQIANMGAVDMFNLAGNSSTITELFGAALFVFDNGIPADLATAVAWMTAAWQAGNKAIYPGWKGKAL